MRWPILLAALLMAGCTDSGEPPLDPSRPIHAGWGLHHFGPEAGDESDAHVAVVDCRDAQQIRAYTVDAAAAVGPGATAIQLYTVDDSGAWPGNIQRFVLVAFAPDDGLVPILAVGGDAGLETATYRRAHTGSLAPAMPERFEIPVGDDGLARFVVGCNGPTTLNYVIANEQVNEGSRPQRPHYLPSVEGVGYGAFLGHAMDAPLGSIPPVPGGVPPTVTYEIGSVAVAVDHVDAPGVMRGTTTVEWTAGPGWTHVYCGHDGDTEHGSWSYVADLHGEQREAFGTIVNNAGMYYTPDLLGAPTLFHMGGGGAPVTIRYQVQHELSVAVFWNTGCDGFHLGSPLDVLFGMPAGARWIHAAALAQ